MCVYSNSRNDVPRVAQRYGTIAAHTRRRASVLVVFVVFFVHMHGGIRVAVGDCSVTERWRWRPPYQNGKTVPFSSSRAFLNTKVHIQCKRIQNLRQFVFFFDMHFNGKGLNKL